MKILNTEDTRQHISTIPDEALAGESTITERSGKPIATVVTCEHGQSLQGTVRAQ